MGLFIGASILTILELFDYIYEVRHLCFLCPAWCGLASVYARLRQSQTTPSPMCSTNTIIIIN